jgi:type II secretory pathway component PulF
MSDKRVFSLPWSWWIRAGERLSLGLDVLAVLSSRMSGRLPRGSVSGLERIVNGLKRGRALVEAMREAGMVLPMEAWCLLEAGERTGRLGEAMNEVGTLLQQQESRRRELMGQAWYPALVGLTALAVMGLILLWVVPQMREVGTAMGMGDDLPWLTSHIGALYGGLLGAALGFAGAAGCMHLLFDRMGRHRRSWAGIQESVLGAIPFLGRIRYQLRESRLLKQVGTLLDGGLTLPQALGVAAEGRANLWEKEELEHFRTRLLSGSGFDAAARDCALIDPVDAEMLQVGQESGRLDTWMHRIAETQSRAAEQQIARLTRFLEPVFLLFLSAAVGGLILAYLLPMVRMLEQAGGAFN